MDKYVNFEKGFWLELVKYMWRNQRILFQDHLKYICNVIVKQFRLGIIHYAERVQDLHDLSNYLPPPSMKGDILKADSWKLLDKEFSEYDIRVYIKDWLPSSMQDELEDNQ